MRAFHTLALAVLGGAALLGCTTIAPSIVGSGTSATEQRSLPDFTELRVSHAIAVAVTIGSPTSVSVSADDNVLPRVKTTVAGGRLDIAIEGSVQVRTPVTLTVTVPSLTALGATSAGRVTVTGLAADSLAVSTESAGVIDVAGQATTLTINAASSGVATLGQLAVGDVSVDIESVGRATITPTGRVTGSVESGGILVIEGSPAAVEVSTGSAGQVIRR